MDYRYEPILPNRDLPFKMFLFEGMNGNYVRDRHWHREIEIFAVFEGELTFILGDLSRTLSGGQLVVVNSNEVHAIRAPKPNHTLVVQIPLPLFRDYLSPVGMISFHHTRPEQDAATIDLLQKLYASYDTHEKGYQYKAQSLFFELLYILVTKYQRDSISPEIEHSSKNLARLSRITDYIAQNYAQDLDLESIARTFNYTPTYLAHMFRKYAGTTFKVYLQGIRLEHARLEMDETSKSIIQIAADNGFASSRAFAHVFRQQYGILPSQYHRE